MTSPYSYTEFANAISEKNLPEHIVKLLYTIYLNYQVLFLIDDSGSTSDLLDPEIKTNTIENEIHRIIIGVFLLASLIDPDGIDLKFLNNNDLINIKSKSDLTNALKDNKSKYSNKTPLSSSLNKLKDVIIGWDKQNRQIVILTDGLDDNYNINTMTKAINNLLEITSVHVTIVVITSDKNIQTEYDLLDYSINKEYKDRFDIVRPFSDEKKRCRGKLSENEYYAKIILGSIFPSIGKMNEAKKSHKPMILCMIFFSVILCLNFQSEIQDQLTYARFTIASISNNREYIKESIKVYLPKYFEFYKVDTQKLLAIFIGLFLLIIYRLRKFIFSVIKYSLLFYIMYYLISIILFFINNPIINIYQ